MTSIDTILAIEHDTDFNLIEFYFIYRINNNNNNNNKLNNNIVNMDE